MTKDCIVLYQFDPVLNLPISEGPYAAKLEVYCRLAGRPYVTELGSTLRSPNSMIPYVRWPDGTLQAESGDIMALMESRSDVPLDRGLDPQRLASGQALAARVELVCYNACLHDRFAAPEGWAVQRPLLQAYVEHIAPWAPGFMMPTILWGVRRKQRKRAAQTMADVPAGHALAIELVEQVSQRLDVADFLCADQPSTVDCSVWGTLVHLAATPVASPSRDALRSHDAVMAWIERVAARADLPLGTLWRTQ